MKPASKKKVIADLAKLGIETKGAEEFYGDPSKKGGLWIMGTEGQVELDGLPLIYGYYEINPVLEATLGKLGWFAEPYDAGTLMAWPG